MLSCDTNTSRSSNPGSSFPTAIVIVRPPADTLLPGRPLHLLFLTRAGHRRDRRVDTTASDRAASCLFCRGRKAPLLREALPVSTAALGGHGIARPWPRYFFAPRRSCLFLKRIRREQPIEVVFLCTLAAPVIRC